ncbi:UDP-N-acetylmuramoyl-L-alanyl-D-glutamate--2,6-diaminopimelate ligase [Aestuariicella sp. G3-2]|nr:UDP-N-acetylmuramoyl-L-alanyl-D-glutamate--2,6-diaminopimelate ligase [Aestuariicella albida]
MMTQRIDTVYPTLGHLLPALSLQNVLNIPVGPLVLDSRQVSTGDTFVALAGSQADGSQYIDSALKNGAALVLVEGESESCEPLDGGVYRVALPDLRQRLSALAGSWYGVPSRELSMVAITGTNGKTTCSHWLAQLLNDGECPAASVGTLGFGLVGQSMVNTGMTTPDAIATQKILSQLRDDGAKSVVMEVSSHSLDQGRVAAVEFDVAVFTNIGRDHLDYHGDMASYVASKAQLMSFGTLKSAVINADDTYAETFIQALSDNTKLLTYGLQKPADFSFQDIQYLPEGIVANLRTPESVIEVRLPVWGEFNLQNLLAVVASGYALGRSVEELVSRLPGLKPVPGRLESVDDNSELTVLVDFAHTADALESVLTAIRHHSQQRLWCVFGCGGDRDAGKRPLMARAAEKMADEIVVTSDNPRTEDAQKIINEVMAGFSKLENVHCLIDREDAIRYAINHASAGDCILIAGKGHEDYQQIGTEKLPFSDTSVARSILRARVASRQGGSAND